MSLALRRAVRALEDGGVIAYPTEAVWGLGCDPADPLACARLLALKRRPVEKGLIVIAARLEDLGDWLAPVPAAQAQKALQSWPGPYTWLWPVTAAAPVWVTGGQPRLAIRLTAHPLARALCEAFGPLISTSANRSGETPARSASQVRLRFGQRLDALLPGATGGAARPTEIRDLLSGEVLRL